MSCIWLFKNNHENLPKLPKTMENWRLGFKLLLEYSWAHVLAKALFSIILKRPTFGRSFTLSQYQTIYISSRQCFNFLSVKRKALNRFSKSICCLLLIVYLLWAPKIHIFLCCGFFMFNLFLIFSVHVTDFDSILSMHDQHETVVDKCPKWLAQIARNTVLYHHIARATETARRSPTTITSADSDFILYTREELT